MQNREDIRLHTLIEEDKTQFVSDLSQRSIQGNYEITSKVHKTTSSESESFIVEESPAEEKYFPIRLTKLDLIPKVKKQEGVE